MKVKARFVISASKPSEFPKENLPEIAVVGRSNVGKSSLIMGKADIAAVLLTFFIKV